MKHNVPLSHFTGLRGPGVTMDQAQSLDRAQTVGLINCRWTDKRITVSTWDHMNTMTQRRRVKDARRPRLCHSWIKHEHLVRKKVDRRHTNQIQKTPKSSPSVPSNTPSPYLPFSPLLLLSFTLPPFFPSFGHFSFSTSCFLHVLLLFPSPRCLYVFQFPSLPPTFFYFLYTTSFRSSPPSVTPLFASNFLHFLFITASVFSPPPFLTSFLLHFLFPVYLTGVPGLNLRRWISLHRLSGSSWTLLTQLCRQRNISAPVKRTQRDDFTVIKYTCEPKTSCRGKPADLCIQHRTYDIQYII